MGLITMRGNFSLGVSSSTSLHRRGKFGEMLNFFDISILGRFGGSLVYFCSLAVRHVFAHEYHRDDETAAFSRVYNS